MHYKNVPDKMMDWIIDGLKMVLRVHLKHCDSACHAYFCSFGTLSLTLHQNVCLQDVAFVCHHPCHSVTDWQTIYPILFHPAYATSTSKPLGNQLFF